MASSTSYLLMRHFQFAPIGYSSGFFGGQAVSIKLGTKSPQFYYAEHIDVRTEPSEFTVLPAGVPASSGTITDLLLDMDQINSGYKYAVGDTGNIYQFDTSNTVSYLGNMGQASGAGLIYRSDVDHIYITGQNAISRIKRVSSVTNNLQIGWLSNGQSSATSCNSSGGTLTYTVPAYGTPQEYPKDLRSFTSDLEPLYQLSVRVNNKGTGDWTLTLHDDANDVLATVTITNANLPASGYWANFVFATPISIQRGNLVGSSAEGSALTYHFHLTSTVADGSIFTTTSGSMATCDMQLWAYPLVTTRNQLHPVLDFSNYTLIGNGRYLAQYEPLQDTPQLGIDYKPHRLTFPPGYETCGLAQENLLCVIATEKRSTSGQFQDGALFFWDGVSTTYNDWWPIPEGSPEAIFSHQNTVYFIASGALYYLKGNYTPVKLRQFRNTNSVYSNTDDTTHCYPNMMTVRRNILHFAYPSYTTNQLLEHSVNSYGQSDSSYPLSYTFNDYTLSTGTRYNNGLNNLKIGMIKNYGNNLYISWRDDSATPSHGVDIVSNTSAPFSTATIESLVFDGGGRVQYPKKVSIMVATFLPLPAGCTIKLKYKKDRESTWHYSTDVDSTQFAKQGDTFIAMNVDKRFSEFQYGMDITVGSVTPHITSLNPYVDYQILERPIGAGGSLDG